MSALRHIARALGIGQWDHDDLGRLRRGNWIQTVSGRKVFPLDPRADEVDYDDICLGLAREWRFGNHSAEYSVAQHSVLVSMYAEKLATDRGWWPGEVHEVACEGLLHDAAEAYLGDIPRPIKRLRVMRGYCRAEKRWWPALCERFGLRPTRASTALVKEVDSRLLIDEIRQLMPDPGMWARDGRYTGVSGLGVDITPMRWTHAADIFTERFIELFSGWS